ncbi:PIG-L family deacetylase [Candidatus Woesearchaeota archaeon]|nr:PIG-L family deacetylase [Candidatus Woesearchaeota archaeon]
MKKDTVIVLCAHNDDQIIGVGGTMAKYAKEGKRVLTIIFSYGETSHPHLKPEVIRRIRVKESLKSDKILGGAGVKYLGLKEGKFADEIKRKKIEEVIKRLIEKEKPSKVFTHTGDDPHPDHREVNKFVRQLADKKIINCEVYSFEVWNPIKLKKRNAPKLAVDITSTFKKKIEAFKAHESQQMTMLNLLWSVYWRAITRGFKNNCKYAEIFYKIQ